MTWWWPTSPREAVQFLNLMLLLMFIVGPCVSGAVALLAWRFGWFSAPEGSDFAASQDQDKALRRKRREFDSWRK